LAHCGTNSAESFGGFAAWSELETAKKAIKTAKIVREEFFIFIDFFFQLPRPSGTPSVQKGNLKPTTVF
jgi:hypothetical protein